MIRIIGAVGKVADVDELLKKILFVAEKKHVCIQILNADVVYGKVHLVSAAQHAIRAMKEHRHTMNSLAMEVLLYASGERQIKLGITKIGAKKGTRNVAFVIIDNIKEIPEASGRFSDADVTGLLKTLQFLKDDKVLEGDKDTLTKFGITTKELETVPKEKYGHLILEKVAMVDVIK